MIIARLLGGLGNQIFQYSLGRHLAIRLSAELKFDITGFETFYKLHKYSLWSLNIKENFASKEEIELFTAIPEKVISKVALKFKRKFNQYAIITEPHFHFYERVFELKGNIYLDGYWQAEKYFKSIREIILKECSVKNELSGRDKEIAEMMSKTNAVCMHIRRADYVKNTNTNDVLGTCSIDYYTRSADIIAEKKNDPTFFVFSDDHEWVKENIKLNYPVVYVDHNNADKNFEDLRLMSLCKHNVIANSSFSWWGAWLNNNPEKMVIAPQKWFNNFDANTKDLYPVDWIKI